MTNSITEIKINSINYKFKTARWWYLKCLHQYADFSGRARRREYWTFVLINLIISVYLLVLRISLGWLYQNRDMVIDATLLIICVLIPSLAVVVRRLHDV